MDSSTRVVAVLTKLVLLTYSLLIALFWKVGKADQCVHLEKGGHNDNLEWVPILRSLNSTEPFFCTYFLKINIFFLIFVFPLCFAIYCYIGQDS